MTQQFVMNVCQVSPRTLLMELARLVQKRSTILPKLVSPATPPHKMSSMTWIVPLVVTGIILIATTVPAIEKYPLVVWLMTTASPRSQRLSALH